MKPLSLRSRLLRYLAKRREWVSSGHLQRLVLENTSYLPRTAVRRLEEMVEDDLLDVDIRDKHAWYKIKDGVKAPKEPNPDWIQGVGILGT